MTTQRPIKFKAWIKPEPDYDEPGKMTTMDYSGMPFDDEHECRDVDGNEYLSSEPVWLQFTGVTDKNGREIYEGDIVEAWDNGRKASFEVRYRNTGAPMFILWPAYQQGEFWNLHGPQDTSCLVLGNIYENPELARDMDGESIEKDIRQKKS